MAEQKIYERELEEIRKKIKKQLEVQKIESDSWGLWWRVQFLNYQTYSERKVFWEVLKEDIERKFSLIKENEKDNHFSILSKFYSQLTIVQEQIGLAEQKITAMKKEKSSLFITLIIMLIIFGFVYYYLSKNTN